MKSLPPPDDLGAERDAVITGIYAAWKGVTRGGGVSWSESVVYDNYGTKQEALEARAQDTEPNWEVLVDDPNWRELPGIGGFSSVDAIGFRYYIAPALVRLVRLHDTDFGMLDLCSHLELSENTDESRRWRLQKWSMLDSRQSCCIARALRYLACHVTALECHDFAEWCWSAYNSYWKQFDQVQ